MGAAQLELDCSQGHPGAGRDSGVTWLEPSCSKRHLGPDLDVGAAQLELNCSKRHPGAGRDPDGVMSA